MIEPMLFANLLRMQQQGQGQQQYNKQSPWLSFAGQALPGVGAAIGALFDTPQDKLAKWSLMQRQSLMNEFSRPRGDVISPYMMQLMAQMNRRSMAPQLGQALRTASRSGAGMSSPQTHNMYMQNWMPLMAQFMNQLQMKNIDLTQGRNLAYDRYRVGLAGG